MIWENKIGFLFGLLIMSIGYANASFQTSTKVAVQSNSQEEEPIERIEVYGLRSLTFYRQQLLNAERDFVKLFNHTIDIDDFRIKCAYRLTRGDSHLKKWDCKHRYDNRIKTQVSQGDRRILAQINEGIGIFYQEYLERIDARKKEQVDYTAKLVHESPELKDAFMAYLNAAQTFQEKKANRLDR